MSEWFEKHLGEVAHFQRGHDLPHSQMRDGKYSVAGSNGVIGVHSEFTTKGPGITIGRSGNIGNAYYYPDDFWAHNTTLYVTDFFGNDPKFIYYLLRTIDFSSFNAGSAVPTLNRNHIHELPVKVPPLPEQKAIAEVLGSLDDKIELLHQQNKTLEGIVDCLFQMHFSSFNDTNSILSDIAFHAKEQVNPFKEPNTVFYHYSLPAFDNGSKPEISIGSSILSNKYRISSQSVLISKLNPKTPRIWLVKNSPVNSICSTEFQVIQPKKPEHLGFIYSFLKSKSVTDELAASAGGTSGSHQRVSPDDIFKLSIPTSDGAELSEFSKAISPLIDKIIANLTAIQLCSENRNGLLPKLMSGDASVVLG